jgi:5-formyltetrahydrofolate cyclo-ligase
MTSEIKRARRIELIALRDSLPESVRKTASEQIVARIRDLKVYQNAHIIGIYVPIGSEADPRTLLKDTTKQFCYPKITDPKTVRMEFRFDTGTMTEGPFHTKEPLGAAVNPADIDLLIVPGLGFSLTGVRIGYGKGYYDRYLKDFPNSMIGMAFSKQIVPTLPQEAFDVLFSTVITDKEVLCIQH